VPVGLIHTSWGGTPAEVWMSLDGIKSEGSFSVLLDRWKTINEGKPQPIVDYYRVEGDKSKTPKPESPVELTPWWPCIPSWVYNAMLAPVIPYGIKGAIWYQGESNDSRAYQYRRLFPAMINNWRELWVEGKFPFFFVQLANFKDTAPEPAESNWAELREAQTMTLSLPKTGMAVAIDIGDGKDIHPKNKQDVGKRLELNALKVAYGKKIVNSGPMYKSVKFKDGRAYIKFTYTGSGLTTKNGEQLKGFAIAGADKKFVWAKAEISGDKVVVWNDKITKPASVRYAWADNPVCNLYNKEGLPASPFRTDNWQGITFGQE
jgi:sialate O-acetylesterase